jgi:hypothetical protein
MTGYCRHQLTVGVDSLFTPKTLNVGHGNGADFLILYAQNFGNDLDVKGTTPPHSGLLLTTVILPTSRVSILHLHVAGKAEAISLSP